MHRYILGAFALVALVQSISCRPVNGRIDALIHKLEDHYHGKNLDNEITFAECQSAFKEFAQLDPDTDLTLSRHPDPTLKVLSFLNDFMYLHLKSVPSKLMKLLTDDEAAKEFVETLEEAYKRFRPVYNYEFNVYEQRVMKDIMRPLEFLAGKSDERPTRDQMATFVSLLNQVKDSGDDICEKQDIYEYQDEIEHLLKIWGSPEALAWNFIVVPVFKVKQEQFFAGDEATVKELQQLFQDGVAEVRKNLQSD